MNAIHARSQLRYWPPKTILLVSAVEIPVRERRRSALATFYAVLGGAEARKWARVNHSVN